MTHINSGRNCSLRSLITSGDISASAQISIFDPNGKFICTDAWYSDTIMAYGTRLGKAYKAATFANASVLFQLTAPRMEREEVAP